MRSPVILALLALLLLSATVSSPGGGKIYLVFGPDTAIWEGMDVAKYHCTYSPPGLYTDPSRSAHVVMDATFRNSIRDSEGKTLKLTWWMMVGNAIRQWGDEISLHNDTFVCADYDGDGTSYWNQAKTFGESRVGFDGTLV